MAYGSNDFQGLVLTDVTPLEDSEELGRGAYGKVYAVEYCGKICAAKEIHSILVEGVGEEQMRRTANSFLRECQQCSKLRHPNIIQFLGVYYPPESQQNRGGMMLPIMVMEMMKYSLKSRLDAKNLGKIPIRFKFSIVHDVSLGLCYLHSRDPPIVRTMG